MCACVCVSLLAIAVVAIRLHSVCCSGRQIEKWASTAERKKGNVESITAFLGSEVKFNIYRNPPPSHWKMKARNSIQYFFPPPHLFSDNVFTSLNRTFAYYDCGRPGAGALRKGNDARELVDRRKREMAPFKFLSRKGCLALERERDLGKKERPHYNIFAPPASDTRSCHAFLHTWFISTGFFSESCSGVCERERRNALM